MTRSSYAIDVFINCPFDRQYKSLFDAVIFTIFWCGFRPRCVLEIGDAAQIRIDKILNIISECKYGLHDISQTALDPRNKLPRFNMPFELGLFLAARRFGTGKQKQKACLIMDSKRYRYRKFISDISGQDIQAHGRNTKKVIKLVRNWLSDASRKKTVPGGSEIFRQYERFSRHLPTMCKDLKLRRADLTFNDYANIVSKWITETLRKKADAPSSGIARSKVSLS
jgi:hypothetical protein